MRKLLEVLGVLMLLQILGGILLAFGMGFLVNRVMEKTSFNFENPSFNFETQNSSTEVVNGDWAKNEDSKNYILEIPFEGTIMSQTDVSSHNYRDSAYGRLMEDLDKAEENKDFVKAVIIRVNSPGGGVTASDTLFHRLKRFKEEKHIPVYAYYENVAASGAVYTTMIADEIYCHPTAITGSIGVIMHMPEIKELLNKLGVQDRSFKSGGLKDMGNYSRSASEKEELLFNTMVNDLFNRFVDLLIQSRPHLKREAVVELQGSFFLGTRALELGLVDKVCQLEEAYESIRAKNEAWAHLPVVRYENYDPMQDFLARFSSSAAGYFLSEVQKAFQSSQNESPDFRFR